MSRFTVRNPVMTLAMLVLVSAPGIAWAADEAGKVQAMRGEVYADVNGGGSRELKLKDQVFTGETVRTGDRGMVKIFLKDGSVVALGRKSKMTFQEFKYDAGTNTRTSTIQLATGQLKALIGKAFSANSSFKVKTNTAVAGVRGTHLVIEAGAGFTNVLTIDGEVEVQSPDGSGSVILGPGLFTTVRAGQAPSPPSSKSDIDMQNLSGGAEVNETPDVTDSNIQDVVISKDLFDVPGGGSGSGGFSLPPSMGGGGGNNSGGATGGLGGMGNIPSGNNLNLDTSRKTTKVNIRLQIQPTIK
ncbi:MAG: hypothetical protein GMKNLPBB_01634 [Myxococcota bacterium]|nr:hypothetical protein [Myxococcota bacterium]